MACKTIRTYTLKRYSGCMLAVIQGNAVESGGDVLFAGRRQGIQGLTEPLSHWECVGEVVFHRKVFRIQQVFGWNQIISVTLPRSPGARISRLIAKETIVLSAINTWTCYGDNLRGKRIGFIPFGSRYTEYALDLTVGSISDIAKILTPDLRLDIPYPKEWFVKTEMNIFATNDTDLICKGFDSSPHWQIANNPR
jgi:hypothetical protein